ncbi:hypothetical protein BD410DRAFT_356476 [Rickenella mellea]|uniref:Uncharacterized protein n=1 Tax=Rickenella mellea TaxID=50990 RepID=A0A4Y7Q1V0_9AGAM|nr:hypothetical protein BD410DRAFT_356476 [Rickenella mellea]
MRQNATAARSNHDTPRHANSAATETVRPGERWAGWWRQRGGNSNASRLGVGDGVRWRHEGPTGRGARREGCGGQLTGWRISPYPPPLVLVFGRVGCLSGQDTYHFDNHAIQNRVYGDRHLGVIVNSTTPRQTLAKNWQLISCVTSVLRNKFDTYASPQRKVDRAGVLVALFCVMPCGTTAIVFLSCEFRLI